MTDSPKQKIGVTVVSVVAAILAGAVAQQVVRSVMGGGGSGTVSNEALGRVASEVNKQAPMMVDRDTELSNAIGANGTLVYNYRLVNIDASQISENDLRSFRPSVIASVCSTPATRDGLLNRGVTMRYSYADRNRVYIGSFDVRETDCGS